MNTSEKVVIGTLAGVALGAIVGILFAPEKGSTTRKQISDKSEDYLSDLRSKFDDLSNAIVEKFESTKNDAESLANKGKAKYSDAKETLKDAASDVKETASVNK